MSNLARTASWPVYAFTVGSSKVVNMKEEASTQSGLMYMKECPNCTVAKKGGVHTLISHLAKVHCIPTEWPSERAAKLTGPEAEKPYTTIAATRKKRKKTTTPRPLNSFMVSCFA